MIKKKDACPRYDLIFLTTNAELKKDDKVCAALIREGRISVASFSSEARIEFLFVSQNAFDALNRYKAKLERDAYVPKYSFSNYGTGYHSLHDPVERISCSLVAKACTGLCCCLGITGAALYGIINHISNSLSETQD